MQQIKDIFQRLLPDWAFRFLFIQKYFHFFFTGVTGVALNLSATWFFTGYVFGIEGYFDAYLIGIALLPFTFDNGARHGPGRQEDRFSSGAASQL